MANPRNNAFIGILNDAQIEDGDRRTRHRQK